MAVSIQRVLFVCAGNICRSPMAEGLMRRLVETRPALAELEVGSAGVAALTGRPPSAGAVAAMREEFGLDISGHRARQLTRGLAADLVLTMDSHVTDRARALGLDGRVELLGDFAGSPGEEVEDPYLGSPDEYRRCARQIARLVEAVADRLIRERSGGDVDAR
jgi:protein-tyrosine phosphatase